jgi:hypothetical protein
LTVYGLQDPMPERTQWPAVGSPGNDCRANRGGEAAEAAQSYREAHLL